MAAATQITRANPSCFLFLIDQSTSMRDPFGGSSTQRSKAEELADAINQQLVALVTRCSKGEEIRNYFDIGLIGYGGQIGSGFGGDFVGQDLVAISELGMKPLRIEDRTRKISDGAGGLVDENFRFPIWLTPTASGGTPMCQGLSHAAAVLERWVSGHPESYPPTLLHVTDGESTDGDPSEAAQRVHGIRTNVGPVAFFNLHLSSKRSHPISFPNSEHDLPDDFARTLFRISSLLPELLRDQARAEGYLVDESSRAFAFNADVIETVKFLNIGTRTDVAR